MFGDYLDLGMFRLVWKTLFFFVSLFFWFLLIFFLGFFGFLIP